jgi:antitoxin MazE
MITKIRRVGDCIIIPEQMLEQAGLKNKVEITVERGAIVLRNPRRNPREGWAEASRRIAAAGDDKLTWPEFRNQHDLDLQW